MTTKLKKLYKLSYADKKLYLNAFWTLLLVRVALFILPFEKVWTYYNKQVEQDLVITDSNDQIVNKVARAVNRCADVIPGTVCLPKAFAVQNMLYKRGYRSHLHIGATKRNDGEFTAHAWIERDEKVIIGDLDDLQTFASF